MEKGELMNRKQDEYLSKLSLNSKTKRKDQNDSGTTHDDQHDEK
jgi:hypothetical protein